MEELTLGDLIQAVSMLVMALGVIVILFRSGAKAADDQLVRLIQDMLNDRHQITQAERVVTHATSMMQGTLNILAETVKVLAPMTAIKADDELAKWLDDIRKPGPPVDDEPAQEAGAVVGDETIKT